MKGWVGLVGWPTADSLKGQRKFACQRPAFYHGATQPTLMLTLWQYSDGDPHNGGNKCRWSMKNRHFRPILRFISDMYIYMYYETPVRTRMRSIEWCHFHDLEWHLTQISRSRHYLAPLIQYHYWTSVHYKCMYNSNNNSSPSEKWKLDGVISNYLEWLSKNSLTHSIAWPLCDSWVSCLSPSVPNLCILSGQTKTFIVSLNSSHQV